MRLLHERSGTDIGVILASRSRFFLRGLSGILEDAGGISIVAQASSYKEVEEYLAKTKADFLFIDNRTLKLDIARILNLAFKITPLTEIICLDGKSTDVDVFANIVYIPKETSSSELIRIIKRKRKGVTGFVSAR